MKLSKVLPGILATSLTALIVVGIRWTKRRRLSQQIWAVLQDESWERRTSTLTQLSKSHFDATLDVLVRALDHPDVKVGDHAALFLPRLLTHYMVTLEPLEIPTDSIINHLLHSDVAKVREACATVLAPCYSAAVEDAYMEALKDSNDSVIITACSELARRGVVRAIPALRCLLTHPSWSARLFACQALIDLKAVDGQVVSTLEILAREPEAIEHDRLTQMCRQIYKEHGLEATTEKVISETLEQSRLIAAK